MVLHVRLGMHASCLPQNNNVKQLNFVCLFESKLRSAFLQNCRRGRAYITHFKALCFDKSFDNFSSKRKEGELKENI